MADFTLKDEGTISLLTPWTMAGEDWLDMHIGADNGFQPYWPTVVIEWRYVDDIIAGITSDGLTVEAAE